MGRVAAGFSASRRESIEPGTSRFEDTAVKVDPEAQFETIMAVRDAEIGEPPYPNWTAVGVTWLAGFDFEIKVIARISAAAA